MNIKKLNTGNYSFLFESKREKSMESVANSHEFERAEVLFGCVEGEWLEKSVMAGIRPGVGRVSGWFPTQFG